MQRLNREIPSLAPHGLDVLGQVMNGNIPDFLRRPCAVNVTNVSDGVTNRGRFFVLPDYLAIGSDQDYLLAPIRPDEAQCLADKFHFCLPTPKMVDAIYAAADVKLIPQPIAPSKAMTSIPVFIAHDQMVKTQRAAFLKQFPLGALTAGHKKDVVISAKLNSLTNRVAIYGWHQTNGVPIQPLYAGHSDAWVDYSHGVRLVCSDMEVNGQPTTVEKVLADPKLCGLLSDEGVITNARYSNFTHPVRHQNDHDTGLRFPDDFLPARSFGELELDVQLGDQVRMVVDAPSFASFSTNRPLMLVLYALPNGNTIEQTIGRRTQPGDDWHFNIQHIGAQTRWLRHVLTNHMVVVAYLENELKSWPAWRKARNYDNSRISAIVERVKGVFDVWQVQLILTGHSGGGSFTFGFLEDCKCVPNDVSRIAFLDSNYAYDSTNHSTKLVDWLNSGAQHKLCVLAYQDYLGLLDGRSFVSTNGGTWGRSLAMLEDLRARFSFERSNRDGLQHHSALSGRVQFFLKENPERKILHTVQVERNGFIHAMLSGTPLENQGYEYLVQRCYENWIE